MTKAATVSEQAMLPAGGKWTWKEGDTPSLEFISNNPADKLNRRGQRKQGGKFLDPKAGKAQDRGATPNRGIALRKDAQGRVAGVRSPKQSRKGTQHQHVTLEDVKIVSRGRLAELEEIPEEFEEIFGTEQLDHFLMYLLNYFNCFYEKMAHEQKPNPMNIMVIESSSEPSLAEKQYYADLCAKLDKAQKQLGQAYCVLVLGVGLEHQHHMGGGASRVSSTRSDRNMFETLYAFSTFVVWISFKRKMHDVVRKEVGRMLRSDTFNPAVRVKNAPDQESLDDELEGDKKEKKEEKKLTPAEYRRLHGKRPAIKSIINQRSPALVSILPSPREDSSWLFNRSKPLTAEKITEKSNDPFTTAPMEEQAEMNLDLATFKMGIIGEPVSQYNPATLTPIGAENEDEETSPEEKTGTARESTNASSSQHGKTSASQLGGQDATSRQHTAISTATTDAPSDEDD